MRHTRVLLLGPTGVDKSAAASRLAGFLRTNFAQEIRFVDFENQFLKPRIAESASRNWTTFLAQDIPVQATGWRAAWNEFRNTLNNEITILGLHATYVSNLLGLRCPINIPSICEDFHPTLIITLIDDVYSMWGRTEARAAGDDWKGRPNLEYLISARRAEQILGDVVMSHMGPPGSRHILCATSNTLESIANLILFDAGVTYLSFPISAPRRLEEAGDTSFLDLINDAHRKALGQMRADRSRAFISPLAIDELPLVFRAENASDSTLGFDASADRWEVAKLWGEADAIIVPSLPGSVAIPIELIRAAEGMVKTDVGWRDRRLVQQASCLAIVCPKPPNENRITRGVSDEIQTATAVGTRCFLWQKPEWDRDGFVETQFPAPGSMGASQVQALVKRVETLDELIQSKP